MRLNISRTKNAASYYVIETVYEGKKERSRTVEKLGTEKSLREKLGDIDIEQWARDYVSDLNKKEKEGREPDVIKKYSPLKQMLKGEQRYFNGGYLFLEQLYYALKIDKLAGKISKKHKFTYDMNNILSRLLYTRILFPGSKRYCSDISQDLIEPPTFDAHHIYRALDVIEEEGDVIQSTLYKNSLAISKRNTGILYYDCTNYFFEIEQESGMKKYGYSKEHKPNPIVQMGLFMDGDGIPLAFNITDGNTNEQKTLRPLEEQIIADFDLSKFIVCTDAGLASTANRKFNDKEERGFITTQPIKKLKGYLKEWALSSTGWMVQGYPERIDISKLDDEKYLDSLNAANLRKGAHNFKLYFTKETINNMAFYKERWINEDNLEQRMVVTYSPKYKNYQRKIRGAQLERATKLITGGSGKLKKVNSNDCRRFILKTECTKDGEIANKTILSIDEALIRQEERYDGFYAVCTNLDGSITQIIQANKRRWQIEECFRIMKSEFKARPVYLQNDNRIKAHFTTCFMALLIYRLLEKKLNDKYTCSEIVDGLRSMNFLKSGAEGYIPTYTRTDFTDDLHEAFGFRTDFEIVSTKQMKNILKIVKK